MVRLMASPMPSPSCLVEKKASNSFSCAWVGTPGAAVLHRKNRAAGRVFLHLQGEQALSRHLAHGIDGVDDQVEDDLLQLDVVGEYLWGTSNNPRFSLNPTSRP